MEVAVRLSSNLVAVLGGSLTAMGKRDAKQPKLNFDHKRSTRQGELVQRPQATEERDLAADDQGEDLRTLMLEMRSGLRNIDTKLDDLASQLDTVKTQVATHETRPHDIWDPFVSWAREQQSREYEGETMSECSLGGGCRWGHITLLAYHIMEEMTLTLA
ncbi:hypothetical protein NDU88_001479 [Pleurodeles waltl]|uniref:Uncharacterized protein n=1 Tax=Pleurodeles waltl TaxID=8319 RepID=A0AAV7P3W0_PLEWA|nr:hypothetical protein NDU88_001479 [Pleurodeles waltl]